MKYNKKLLKEMAEWVEEHGLMDYGGATLRSFTEFFGFEETTYYRWLEKVDFVDAIENAKEKYKKKLARELAATIADMARGGQESKKTKRHREYRATADGRQGRLEKIVEDEEIQITKPNLGAAIFLLTNADPEKYRNRQNVDSNVKVEKTEELSREDAVKELARLEALDNLNEPQQEQEDNAEDDG